jgi:hypothetical protein
MVGMLEVVKEQQQVVNQEVNHGAERDCAGA